MFLTGIRVGAHFHTDITCTDALLVMLSKRNKWILTTMLKSAPGHVYVYSPLDFVSFIFFLFFPEIIYSEVTKMKYYFAAELFFTEATINHIIWPSKQDKTELDKSAIRHLLVLGLLQKISFIFLELCSINLFWIKTLAFMSRCWTSVALWYYSQLVCAYRCWSEIHLKPAEMGELFLSLQRALSPCIFLQ